MPPLKQPANLQSLALNAIVKLFIAFCSNVDKTCSENVECPHQASHKPSAFCRQCCQIDAMQKVICDQVAPKLWDAIVDTVESYAIDNAESFRLKDYQIFYALLIHPNMRKFQSKILSNNNRPNLPAHSDNNIQRDTKSLGGIPCTDFWIELIPYFANILKLDLTFLRHEATEIFRLVGTVCAELEEISFNTDDLARTLELLAPCKKLRSIEHEDLSAGGANDSFELLSSNKEAIRQVGCKLALELFPRLEVLSHGWSNFEMSNTIASLDPSTRLKLRHLYEPDCTLDSFRRIATICPRLDSLYIVFNTTHHCTDVMTFLSTSPLVITKLTITADHSVRMDCPAIMQYFQTKGRHLQKLTLRYHFHYRTLCVVAKHCSNLLELTLDRRFAHHTDFAPDDEPRSVLSRLGKLRYFLPRSDRGQLSRVFATLLPPNSSLSELDITVLGPDCEPLQQLGDSSWFANLSRLTVRGASVPDQVARHFYEKGERLTELCVHVSDKALTSVEDIRREVKENNLQFNIVIL